MRSPRIAVSVAVVGALALPLLGATSASAAPAQAPASAPTSRPCDRPGPWAVHTNAVTIRSKASTKSTAVGVLYRSHRFTVHKTSGNWHYITDKSTGVKGWVSGSYVYRDVYMCLD
ncbi:MULTISPECIES: SH3 domain-containing protein [unclassified Streptomyces]|uniref:SH3 domain-containing protein n=1 Tax=unclassified Streptomyces TaxID=2593676 RepID=UPI000823B2B6|nr:MULTISPECIES: SH3 domain-containing protein [unclassified Streptomyces]MYT96590.1 SH3 domain-containing protein [Streptomyces sp. SID8350]SCK54062.1 SH3 domain-containing protein [Streptomyces sp. AmelKG-D3]